MALLLIGAGARGADAGAWTQPRGAGYYKVASQVVRGSDLRDGAGASMRIPLLAEYTLSVYAEHGLRDDLTLVAYLPLFKRITLNRQVGRPSGFVYFGGDAVNGIADAEVGLRYRLWQAGNTAVSAGVLLGLPLGDSEQPNGLFTGDGEMNQRLALQLGHSLYPAPAYLGVDLGYDNRQKGYADAIHYAAEAGITFRRRVTAILHVSGRQSLDNGDDEVSGGAGGLYANNQRYLSYGPQVAWALDEGWSLSIGAMSAIRLRNALAATSFAVGLATRR